MATFEIQLLDGIPSEAATRFYSQYLPMIAAHTVLQPDPLTIVFPPADHTHRGWRLAAIQSLAREMLPSRVNAISGGSGPAQRAAIAYLSNAPGLTGQYLPLDDAGAGTVVLSAS